MFLSILMLHSNSPSNFKINSKFLVRHPRYFVIRTKLTFQARASSLLANLLISSGLSNAPYAYTLR